MGRPNQPRDRRGRWTATGRGRSLGSARGQFRDALQAKSSRSGKDNDGRSAVYAYIRDKDSPRGKAGSPYYIGVAGDVGRPYRSHGRTPVPNDERRIRMLRGDLTHKQAREWEKFYIAKYGRQDVKTGRRLLRNRTDGGDGLVNPSAKARARISAFQKRREHSDSQNQAISRALSGVPKSAEHRKSLSESRKGKPGHSHTAESKAKIRAAHLGKKTGSTAKSKARGERITAAAAQKYGFSVEEYSSLDRSHRLNLSTWLKRDPSRTPRQYMDLFGKNGKGAASRSTIGARTKAAAIARNSAKYGVSSKTLEAMTAAQRKAMAARYKRGKRGKDLTDGFI